MSAFLLDEALKCVATEVVLFSVVAFKTLTFYKVVYRLSTHLIIGIFSDCTITNFILILALKKV